MLYVTDDAIPNKDMDGLITLEVLQAGKGGQAYKTAFHVAGLRSKMVAAYAAVPEEVHQLLEFHASECDDKMSCCLGNICTCATFLWLQFANPHSYLPVFQHTVLLSCVLWFHPLLSNEDISCVHADENCWSLTAAWSFCPTWK